MNDGKGAVSGVAVRFKRGHARPAHTPKSRSHDAIALFPYCHQGNIPDQEFGWGRSCDEFTKPVTLLGPHSAPLGMRFYSGTMFPSEYRNAIFVARHGSWNRSKKFGGDIVVVSLNENGTE
jgi:glucose/arabinose dehydrogenase